MLIEHRCVYISLRYWFQFLQMYTQKWIAGSTYSYFFFFLEQLPSSFLQWLYHFTTPPERFPFSPYSCHRLLCLLFDDRHSDRCEKIISFWFWFAFSWWLVMSVNLVSIYTYWPFVCLLVKCLFRFFAHLKNWLFSFFFLELYEFFICFGY